MNESETEKIPQQDKRHMENKIKDIFYLIYCQIGKVNLDTLCACLLCCMIIQRLWQ